MKLKATTLLILAAFLNVTGFAQTTVQTVAVPESSWKVERETSLAQMQTFAVLPVEYPLGLPEREAASEKVEKYLASVLKGMDKGFIPSARFRELDMQTRITMGGYYDPHTGEMDDEKRDAVADLTKREFERIFEFDGYIKPKIIRRSVPFQFGRAVWDQGFDYVGPSTYSGTVPVLSLEIEVTDKLGNTQYVDRGGIQTTKRVQGGGLADVPSNLVLTDSKKIVFASVIALVNFENSESELTAKRDARTAERAKIAEARKADDRRKREEIKRAKIKR